MSILCIMEFHKLPGTFCLVNLLMLYRFSEYVYTDQTEGAEFGRKQDRKNR